MAQGLQSGAFRATQAQDVARKAKMVGAYCKLLL